MNDSSENEDTTQAPSLIMNNFVEQYYRTSTFHHLSQWRVKMQDMTTRKTITKVTQPQGGIKKKVSPPTSGFVTPISSSGSVSFSSEESTPYVYSPLKGTRSSSPSIPGSPSTFQTCNISPPMNSNYHNNSGKFIPEYTVDSIFGTPPKQKRRIILHIDMDCFYASVAVRDNPGLKGKSLVICPSKNTIGTSEVAACSYEAREYGIKSRMLLREARKLCPQLISLPCQFNKYEIVSEQIYKIFMKYTQEVEAVSADEAFLDVSVFDDGVEVANRIRREIYEVTGCTASAGISHNKLLARLATKKAKPNGYYHLLPEDIPMFLNNLPVRELPGVGPALTQKLKDKMGIESAVDLLLKSREELQTSFGKKTGEKLWGYARGIDTAPLKTSHRRKSIGAQMSWGVRFENNIQIETFLGDLASEVITRMNTAGVKGKRIAIKVKKRSADASVLPSKVFDCGKYDEVSTSRRLSDFTCNKEVIANTAYELFISKNILAKDVRGFGIYIDQLNNGTWKGAREHLKRKKKVPEGNRRLFDAFFIKNGKEINTESIDTKEQLIKDRRMLSSKSRRGVIEKGKEKEETNNIYSNIICRKGKEKEQSDETKQKKEEEKEEKEFENRKIKRNKKETTNQVEHILISDSSVCNRNYLPYRDSTKTISAKNKVETNIRYPQLVTASSLSQTQQKERKKRPPPKSIAARSQHKHLRLSSSFPSQSTSNWNQATMPGRRKRDNETQHMIKGTRSGKITRGRGRGKGRRGRQTKRTKALGAPTCGNLRQNTLLEMFGGTSKNSKTT